MQTEKLILGHLIENEEYGRKIIPYLKPEYFQGNSEKKIFELINSYVSSYNAFPTKESLQIDLQNLNNINEDLYDECSSLISELKVDKTTNLNWIIDKTESFCKERAVYNALMTSIHICNDKTGKLNKSNIPNILTDALSVSFNSFIGHNLIDDWQARYEFYHKEEIKIKFDLELFNKITKGGFSRKTLNVILAGTGVGKTLFMTHFATNNLLCGHNVLYITLEMGEEMIAERIDANIMDLTIDELSKISKSSYESKINKIKGKTSGKLIIKEYPPASASTLNFRHLLSELKIKKNFIPDIIYVDYLNLCASSRMKYGIGVNSYTYIKAVAEELRGMAVEFNVPLISATQTTRSGSVNSDPGLEDTSESFGLPATADIMFAIIKTEDLEKLSQVMVKQLKNRYADLNKNKRFVVGIDRSKMKLYDVEQTAQEDIVDDSPPENIIMDQNYGAKPEEVFKGFK